MVYGSGVHFCQQGRSGPRVEKSNPEGGELVSTGFHLPSVDSGVCRTDVSGLDRLHFKMETPDLRPGDPILDEPRL